MTSLSDLPSSWDKKRRTLIRGVRLYTKNGSWRAWTQGASYILRRLGGRALPQTAFLAPTYRCQCNCAICYAAAKDRQNIDEMSTEELKETINQIKALGAIHLNFTGGEPLLRADIIDLVGYAHDIGLITRVSTNGYLLTPDCVAELSRAGLNQCGVALDDADPDTHDRLRGLPGLFEKAIQGFHLLHEHGIESRLMTYACRSNFPQGIERLLELAVQLRVKSVHINFPYASGLWAESFDEMFSEEDMDGLRRFQRFQRSLVVLLEFSTPEAKCCAAKKSMIYINASGEVTPCPVIPYVIGNLREEPLAEIWKRHVDALKIDYRGKCPMNEMAGREALRAHAALVLANDQRCGGVRGAVKKT